MFQNSKRNPGTLLLVLLLFSFINVFASPANKTTKSDTKEIWTGSWATAPQLVEPNNMPPAPGLTNNTLRQIIRVSIGGETIRLRFSNLFSKDSLTLKSVGIAVSIGGSEIDMKSNKILMFKGRKDVTIAPNAEIISDNVRFHLKPGSRLAITICYSNVSSDLTGHPGSRTTSYLLGGNTSLVADFSKSIPTDHWYTINRVEVLTPKTAGAIAVLGNSIADGRDSGINKQNRWPDVLSDQLLKNPVTSQRGVLNLGIGGNCVLRGGLGQTALTRFDRDILTQNNVKWLIISIGINDIGGIRNSKAAAQVAQSLINAYSQFIDKAHAKGIKVYGATILPFAKSFYDADYRQVARDSVNAWIRNSGHFDSVIDLDQVMRNPEDIKAILPDAHSGDFLHPNEAGYKRMGEAIDLKLFK